MKGLSILGSTGSIGVYPLVRVGQVLPGQTAEAAGLRTDDAILSIDGKPVRSFSDIPPIVTASAGRTMTFHLWRGGPKPEAELRNLVYGLTPRPDEGPCPLYEKPALWATVVTVVLVAINVVFW